MVKTGHAQMIIITRKYNGDIRSIAKILMPKALIDIHV